MSVTELFADTNKEKFQICNYVLTQQSNHEDILCSFPKINLTIP